jgi:type IV pilus assembly protein PilQ
MEGITLKRLPDRIFLAALMILLLASPSFSQAPTPETYSIEKIEVTETAQGARVAIEGSKSFEYTVFRLPNPLRVVVDLPQARLGKLAGPVRIQDGTINVIQNRQVGPPTSGARIEIGLDQLVEYDVVSEGKFLFLIFGKPAIPLPKEAKAAAKKETEEKEAPPAPPLKNARSLTAFEISAKVDWVKVDILGDGLIPDYRTLQLSRPTRLVVDLPQLVNASGKKTINVGSRLLKDIRIGQHPDKVRLVFVIPEEKLPPYQLSREGQKLSLFLGELKKESAQLAEAAQKATPREDARATKTAPAVPTEKPQAGEPPKTVETVGVAEAAQKVAPQETAQAKETAPAVPVEKPQGAEPPKPVRRAAAAPKAEAQAKKLKSSTLAEKPPVGIYKGVKISLDFKDADIHNILRLIAEVSGLNIITTDDVKGKITIRLVNVPWDQALEVILATKNLIRIEEGNVLRITTWETLKKEREEKQKEEEILLKTRDTKLKLEEPWKKILKLSYADAVELQKLLTEKSKEGRTLLSPQGSVIADKRTNTLIIQDIRSNLEEIEHLVKQLDSAIPQVLIEARVVQAVTTFARSIGVQWGGSYNQTGGGTWSWGLTGNNPAAAAGWGFTPNQAGGSASTNLIMPSNFVVNFPASTLATPTGGAAISFGKLTGNLVNLDLRLQLGETDGLTRVISRPKLATLDNKEAHIKQGEKIPYETTSQAGTQVQFIDAVLMLKVTPHVTPEGSILMKVLVTRDARGAFRSPVNQVPSIEAREAQTEVLVRDGETLVIGGIYETEKTETEQGIPWLMKVPILGWLFKNQETTSAKRELLIFITPTVIQKKAET